MASMSLITSSPWLMNPSRTQIPSASLSRLSGSKARSSVVVNAAFRPAAFHCSFLSSSSSFSSLSSSFSGLSMGSNFNSESRIRQKRGTALVVRAGKKGVLAMTKRNKSRKSLARVHGFRRRMRTTSGRAILKRRRAKGRWVLCTKTNPNRGK